MKRFLTGFLLIVGAQLFLSFCTGKSRLIKGIVLSDSIHIPSARVRIRASDNFILTGSAGEFELPVPENSDTIIITAWAEGHFNGVARLFPDDTAITINLHRLYEKDNPDYQWTAPNKSTESKGNCGNCHPDALMGPWGRSAHANSATNPYFLAIYYGKDTALVEDRGIGYKKDFPEEKGNCGTCHIPGAAINDPLGVDPISVTDVNRYGVFCDVCHKMRDVDISGEQDYTGVYSVSFLRPPEGKKLFFGPYDDVNEPDAYLPLTKKSKFCAACHAGRSGEKEEYNSYGEWLNSRYPEMGIQCQTCHMAPDGIMTNFAPGKGGLERNPMTIPTHDMAGSRDPKILSKALTMNFTARKESDKIKVMVTLYNDNAGHHIPTGASSRNVILLVYAANENGEMLEFLDGETVPWWGGTGRVSEGNYSGLPGKGFARVLEDSDGHAPAPGWRQTRVLSDSRIAAFNTDTSVYYFKIPAESSKIKVKAKVIYRRFFKDTMTEKEFGIDDIVMESDSTDIQAKRISGRI